MSNVFLQKHIEESILSIAYELKRMNDLKEKELYLEYGYKKEYDEEWLNDEE